MLVAEHLPANVEHQSAMPLDQDSESRLVTVGGEALEKEGVDLFVNALPAGQAVEVAQDRVELNGCHESISRKRFSSLSV
jgi:hypothetical protein